MNKPKSTYTFLNEWYDLYHSKWPQPAEDDYIDIPVSTTFKCPKCGALAYSLWQIYGISYLKCDHCNHKSGNF